MEGVMSDFVRDEIKKTISTFTQLCDDHAAIQKIEQIGEICGVALKTGKKLMLMGNGGSAADAQHIAAEFVSRLVVNRHSLAAIALTTDTSILTAVANDFGYEQVFARQVEGLGQEGDVLIGISTSGRSPSILAALEVARMHKIITVGLTGKTGNAMAELCDYKVCVPSNRTQNVQEVHIMIGHTICAIAEKIWLEKTGVS
jgi:D-sedoheptulose 7-phosphate isomerase